MQLFEGLDLVHPIREVGKETKNIQGPAGFESLAPRTVGPGSTIYLSVTPAAQAKLLHLR